MATSLAEIRAKLAQQDNRKTGSSTSQGDSQIYPHWNIVEGSQAKLRFLPDADPKNSFFWIERLVIKLPFPGVKGQPDAKNVVVQVPCVEMWGDSCPVLAEIRPWYKDPSLTEQANKYWKKKSYLFQGFVRENPLDEDQTPENPIRRFVISPQIYNLIKDALMDPEMENLPVDYENGLDFLVKKSSKGGYADYSTSSWARKESALTQTELAAIEQFGLYNLADFLPKRPSQEELRIIHQMFEASVDGQLYDPERFAQFYKPYGLKFDGGSSDTPFEPSKASPATAPKLAVVSNDVAEDEDEAVVEPVKPAESSKRAEDILAMIRSRKS